MNKYHLLSVLCFIAGFILLALSISLGNGKVYWAVIIFVIEGSGWYSFLGILGILLIFLGFIFLLIGFVSSSFEWATLEDLGWNDEEKYYSKHQPEKQLKKRINKPRTNHLEKRVPRSSIKTGGVIFIGPIPIIWGSDKRITYIMVIVTVVLVVIFLLFAVAWIF